MELAKQRNLSDHTILQINSCYSAEKEMIEVMKLIDDRKILKAIFKRWTALQFYLQRLWGFEEDCMFHRSWYLPKCTCAKMDNDDIYPYGIRGGYWITADCPIHTGE